MQNARALAGAMLGLIVLGLAPLAAAETPFTPGRPGATESAIPVAPGRIQIETELASFSRKDDDEAWSALATTLRLGLARGWDAELIVAPYLSAESEGEKLEGAGDVTLRLRKAFKGLDGGPSLGVIAYVTAPTAKEGLGADDAEGGVLLAGHVALDDAWALSWTTGVSSIAAERGRRAGASAALSIGRGWGERWGAYGEVFADHAQGETAASIGFGATYLATAESQLDAGFTLGVNDAADDVGVFVGWARRF